MPQVNPVRLHPAAPDNTPPRKTSWRDQALCFEVDPELFFPDRTGHYRVTVDEERETLAIAMCNRCPVIEPCLAFALEHREEGVWGGTTAKERTEMRKAAK